MTERVNGADREAEEVAAGTGRAALPPVWLLDVDGVLNAVTDDPDPMLWPDWRRGSAVAEGRRWPITWSPTVTATVARLHGSGAVEVRWLTTWAYDANDGLRELLGLPELTVAGAPGADAAWWKLPCARAVAAEGRRLIWTDDDLAYSSEAVEWVRSMPGCLAIAPDPRAGLTPDDLARIEAHLGQPDGSR